MRKLTTYNLSNMAKTTGRMGYVIPTFLRLCVPGDIWKIKSSYYIKFAAFAGPLSGVFQFRYRLGFVPMRLIWNEFRTWYLGQGGLNSIVEPYQTYAVNTCFDYSDPDQINQLIRYFPIYGKEIFDRAPTATITTSALPFRAYHRFWYEHIQKNMINNLAPDLEQSVSASLPNQTWVQTSGLDTVTSKYLKFEAFDVDAYSRMKNSQSYSAQPTIGGSAFTIQDLRSWLSLSRMRENLFKATNNVIDQIANLFDVPPNLDNSTRLIQDFKSYITLNDILSTAATTQAPLGQIGSQAHGNAIIPETTFTSREFGYLIATISIVPDNTIATGMDKEFEMRGDPKLIYTPGYENLGYIPVYKNRFMTVENSGSNPVIGYNPIYHEERHGRTWVAGDYNGLYRYMTIYRNFNGILGTWNGIPSISTLTYSGGAHEWDYLFASSAEPQFRLLGTNLIEAQRPIQRTLNENDFVEI